MRDAAAPKRGLDDAKLEVVILHHQDVETVEFVVLEAVLDLARRRRRFGFGDGSFGIGVVFASSRPPTVFAGSGSGKRQRSSSAS